MNRKAFLERYGRSQRAPAVIRVLEDAFKLEAYLRRNSIFIVKHVPVDGFVTELRWDRRTKRSELQLLVATLRQSGTVHVRPIKQCNSSLIKELGPALATLIRRLTEVAP
jgi:hypothetical protein